MGAVRRTFCALGLLAASPAVAQPLDRWTPFIAEASTRFGIPCLWIERVMRVESGGRTMRGGRPIRSRAGAIGLMQLMPNTWVAMREALGLNTDSDDPRANILAGTAYLRLMYDRFGYPGLFAAYNAGPGRYARVLEGQGALPTETKLYMTRLVGPAGTPHSVPTRVMDPPFAVRVQHPATPVVPVAERSPLFAILEDAKTERSGGD